MKKRILSCLLALSMLSVPALAAESGTENLVRSTTYTGQFSDLPETRRQVPPPLRRRLSARRTPGGSMPPISGISNPRAYWIRRWMTA